MYLYGARTATGVDNKPPRAPLSLTDKMVARELITYSVYKKEQKDLVSSKMQVKGPKQAEALKVAEISELRSQLRVLPVELREDARADYMLAQATQQRELQEFQCRMLMKVDGVLKQRMTDAGEDFYKFRIGGTDDSTYEHFFRIQPSRYMSKPQFSTALRLVFGEEMVKSSSVANKLFDSFDLRRVDQMDWRAMLYLLTLLMQPTLACKEALR